MDGCLVYGLKHDAKHGKLGRFLVCLEINHGFMYIKGKRRNEEKNNSFYCYFNENSILQSTIYTVNSNGQSTL